MAILKNTTISGNGDLQLPSGPTASRPQVYTNIIQWTNTGSQSYTILSGYAPVVSNTTWTAPSNVTSIEVLVVAGGGGGGSFAGGGGGAGGLIYNAAYPVTPGTSYTVTVGAGGVGDGRPGNAATGASGAIGTNGGNSIFGTLTAIGGGVGGTYSVRTSGQSGGSGGGGWGTVTFGGAGTAGQGNAGAGGYPNGNNYTETAGGGGGAGGPGAYGSGSSTGGSGGGGPGLNFSISGTPTFYAGGGGGGQNHLGGTQAYGGVGGGGNGSTISSLPGGAGTASTGGGGGGASYNGTPGASADGGAGGSGIVIIKYVYADTGRGSELLTDGTFANGITYWTAGSGGTISVTSNVLTITNTATNGRAISNTFTTVIGNFYEVKFTGVSRSSTTEYHLEVRLGADNVAYAGLTIARPYSYIFQATATAHYVELYAIGTTGSSTQYRDISFKQVLTVDPRGLAYYNTDTRQAEIFENTTKSWISKDTTRNFAGHNLFPNSAVSSFSTGQQLNIATGYADPFGGTNAVYLQANTATSTSHSVYKQQNGNANTPMTFSVFAKTDVSGKNLGMYVDGITNGIGYISFNLLTGATTVVTGNSGLISYGSQNCGNGWWRCWITGQTTGSGTYYFHLDTNSGTSSVFADTVGYGIYAYGAQMEQASYPSPYVATSGVATPIPSAIAGYRIHAYTTTGTSGFTAAVSGTVEVLVVGGGGAGGGYAGGGGGAGGVVYVPAYHVISGQSYTVTVGAGGTGTNNGGNSQFGNIVAIGGGRGSIGGGNTGYNAYAGGSGGGAGTTTNSYGSGTSMPGGYVVGQGNSGGQSVGLGNYCAGGGGGAGGPGQTMSNVVAIGGSGGVGVLNSISGTPTYYGGGGGGCTSNNLVTTGTVYPPGIGGTGGGGTSASMDQSGSVLVAGWPANANTGGGGGGGGSPLAGGSGIVIVRYRYD